MVENKEEGTKGEEKERRKERRKRGGSREGRGGQRDGRYSGRTPFFLFVCRPAAVRLLPPTTLPLAACKALSSLQRQMGSTSRGPKKSWKEALWAELQWRADLHGRHEQPFAPSLSELVSKCTSGVLRHISFSLLSSSLPFVLNLPHTFPLPSVPPFPFPLYPCSLSLSPHPPYLRYLSVLSTQPTLRGGD